MAGSAFETVSEFRTKILEKLRREWIEIPNYDRAGHDSGLINFQRELNYPLRVFSLNYDLCVERAYQAEYREYPERGFEKSDERIWNHLLLEEGSPADKNFYRTSYMVRSIGGGSRKRASSPIVIAHRPSRSRNSPDLRHRIQTPICRSILIPGLPA